MGRNIRFILPNCRFIWIPGLGLLLFDDAAAAAADDDDDDDAIENEILPRDEMKKIGDAD